MNENSLFQRRLRCRRRPPIVKVPNKTTIHNEYLCILSLQPRDMAAMLVVNTMKIISKNLHENGLTSERREMLLFLATNMAAVTSRTNQQLRLVTPNRPTIQFDVIRMNQMITKGNY